MTSDQRYDYFCWAPSLDNFWKLVDRLELIQDVSLEHFFETEGGVLATFCGPVPYRSPELAYHDKIKQECSALDCAFDGSGLDPNELSDDEVPRDGLTKAQYVVQQEAIRAGMTYHEATQYAKETV
jgi:hypothetical protein